MGRVDPGLTLLALRKFASLCPFKRPPRLSEQEAQGAARLQAVLNLGWTTWKLHYALAESWLSCHKTIQNPLAPAAPALDDPDSECHSKIWHMMKICVWIDLMILTCYWSRWSRWSPRKRSLLVVMAIAAIAYAAASTAGSAGIFSQARTFCCRYCRCCHWFVMATHGHIIVVKRTCRREHGLFMDWKWRVPLSHPASWSWEVHMVSYDECNVERFVFSEI